MNVFTLPYVLPPYTKPHYRWSRSACVWVLQGLHRLAPTDVYPSNLRSPERYEPGWDYSCGGQREPHA